MIIRFNTTSGTRALSYLLIGAALIFAIPSPAPVHAAPTPIHQFDFNGDLTDSTGSGVTLSVHPNTATSAFGTGEWSWTATTSPGGGLILETDRITDPQSYSLGFRVSFAQVAPGYKKLVSFKGPSSDNGLYYYGAHLNFYPLGTNTTVTYVANTFYDFVFSRSTDDVIRVYVVESNGSVAKVFEISDPNDYSVPFNVDGAYKFMFFMDDESTWGEWSSGGTVRSIRVWDEPLEEGDIADALSDASTGTATDVTDTSATLNGTVSPGDLETSVTFEYGTTTAYGNEVTATQSPVEGTDPVEVSAPLSGLSEGTTYRFRVKATNSNGTFYGADEEFTTLANHTVTFQTDSTPGATLTGVTSQTVAHGSDCSAVTAHEPLGWHFVRWTLDGTNYSTDNPLTVTDVTDDMVLTATYATPGIEVSGGGSVIANGDSTPSTDDATDFGSAEVGTHGATHTFRVSNTGTFPLELTGDPAFEITGEAAADFSIASGYTGTSLTPGQTATYDVQFTPSAQGRRTATVTIASSDTNNNPYSFAIQGNGTAPVISVLGNREVIANGDNASSTSNGTDFGSVLVHSEAVSHTFTIRNVGSSRLSFTNNPPVNIEGGAADRFAITLQPDPYVDPGEETAFKVAFTPQAERTYSATLSIESDSAEDGNYTFTVKGVGVTSLEEKRDGHTEPAHMGTSYLLVDPLYVLPGQEVIVSANACNGGGERGSRTLSLSVNGVAEQSQSLTVSPGACQQAAFRTSRTVPGTYQVSIDGMVGQFTVLAPRTIANGVPSQQATGPGAVGIVAIVIVVLVLIAALLTVFKQQ